MANGIETTLQSIRQGGVSPGQTLAGQIGAIRAERRKARTEAEQNLRDFLLEKQKAETEARRYAVQSQADLDEMRRAQQERIDRVMFGFTQGAATLSDNPARLKEYLARRPRLTATAGLDPAAPDTARIEALRDQYRARVKGEIPEDAQPEEGAKFVRADSELGQELGIDRDMEVKYVGGDLTIDNLRSGETRTTNFEYVGPQQEAGPSRYAEKSQEIIAKEHSEARKRGVQAGETLNQLAAMEEGLQATTRGGFKTGFLGELRQLASQAFSYFNVDPDTVNLGEASSSEVVDSLSSLMSVERAEALSRPNKMALKLVKRSVPNLAKTVQGNLIIVQLLKNTAKREQAIGQIASAFQANSENGTHLDRSVTVAGITLPRGITYQEAVDKYDEHAEPLDEATREYIRKSAEYGGALVAPTGADGRKIDVDAMEADNTYLMPDGRVVKYKGDGQVEVIDDLNED